MEVLKVEKLSKKIKNKQILDNISFSVKQGEIYGFLGPNWAWKTTTMKCIMEFVSYNSGNIEIFKTKWLTLEDKKKIGFMPENTYLYKHLKTEEFLEFNAKFFIKDKKEINKKIEKVLKKVGLEHAKWKYLKEFSKGMLQRVGLAQAIINNPKLVFLDEPMSGLDPIGRKMVKDLIFELKQNKTTVFFNTHILSDVESICDRVSIINKWSLIVEWQNVKEILEKQSLEDFFIEKVKESEK